MWVRGGGVVVVVFVCLFVSLFFCLKMSTL